jgi:hypothetical protein
MDYLQHRVEVGWGGKSDMAAEDMLKIPVPELIERLKGWKSEDEFTGPSTLGLSRELRAAIGRDHTGFIPYTEKFEMVDKPWFVRAYFDGMRDAVRAKKPIDWQSVLNLVEWVMKQGMEITTSEFKPADNMEKDWSWCHAAIAELLKEGMNEATSTGYDFRYRNQTWGIIRPIATTPDPDREARITTDSDYDPYMSAINSVRGKGFEAMVEYGLWYSREYKKEYGKEPGQAEGLTFSFKMIPGFEKAIDFHLKEEKEPSVAIRSLYGQWFPWFVTLDVEWARANVKFIFPKGEENHELYSVAWETYVIYNQPWTGVFPLLEDEYRKAIMDIKHRKLKKRFGGEDPNKRLADHLITLYWWGHLDFDSDDGLLKLLYDNATTEVRAHIIWFVGNSLSKAPKPVNEVVMRRIKGLWAYYLDTLGDLEQHREELSKFTWWFNSGAFDDDPEWAFEQQKKALELGITPDFIPEVVGKLIELIEKHTIQCLEILEGLLVVGANTVANYFWEERAKDVLRIAMKDKSAKVQDKVKSLVNEFMKLGFFDFKDILNKEQEGE